MKTIFNTCVPVDSQETFDRLKKVCVENEYEAHLEYEKALLKIEKSEVL